MQEGEFQSGIREAAARQEKIKKLFGHCFEIARLEEGDHIPTGGNSIFSTKTDIGIEGDFQALSHFFEAAHDLVDKQDLPAIRKWLDEKGINVDERLFAVLFAFTAKYEQTYPDNEDRSKTRMELYKEKKSELKLSDIFNANSAECAEIAALAQVFLQREGVSSSYFSGDVVWEKEWEFSEEHSFIVIRQGDKVYIFDPSNPVGPVSRKFPGLYAVEADFDKEMSQGKKRFVPVRNVLTKREAYYGVNDGTNIVPERHFVK